MTSKVVLRLCSEEISLEELSKTSIRDKVWQILMRRSKEQRKKMEDSEIACNRCQLETKKVAKANKVVNYIIVFGAKPSSQRGNSGQSIDRLESTQSSTTKKKSLKNTSF